MNRTTLITIATAFAALAGAGSAFAEGGEASAGPVPMSIQSRSAVVAEARESLRLGTGSLLTTEASASPLATSTQSRTVVQAELREAVRLGLLESSDAEVRTATPAQLESIRMAGLRAAHMSVAQRR